MLYQEYISKVNALCINIDEGNNVAYINPDYRYLLSLSGLKISDVSDFKDLDFDTVKDELQKTVDAYNARNNKISGVIDFISELLINNIPKIEKDEFNNLVEVLSKYNKTKQDYYGSSKDQEPKLKVKFDTGLLDLTKKDM